MNKDKIEELEARIDYPPAKKLLKLARGSSGDLVRWSYGHEHYPLQEMHARADFLLLVRPYVEECGGDVSRFDQIAQVELQSLADEGAAAFLEKEEMFQDMQDQLRRRHVSIFGDPEQVDAEIDQMFGQMYPDSYEPGDFRQIWDLEADV